MRFSVLMMFGLSLTSPSTASTLIQCPDWQSLVPRSQTVALNNRAPKTSFEDAIARVAVLDTKAGATTSSGKPKTKRGRKLAAASPATCPSYTVKRGDTLAKISKTFLGSYNRYPSLVAANKGKISARKPLKVGTVLTIPCDLQKVANVSKVSNKREATALKKAQAAQSKKAALAKAAAQTVSPKLVTPAKPLPVWKARSGEYLTDVIKRWGKTAGYQVIATGTGDWKLKVPLKEVGSFEDALRRIVKGFSSQGYPPSVRVFSNKVVKIGSIL